MGPFTSSRKMVQPPRTPLKKGGKETIKQAYKGLFSIGKGKYQAGTYGAERAWFLANPP